MAKDTIIWGRRTIPLCFAVGCTKTALICEEKTGKMITTFRSVNDTRQAYFKSTLVKEDMVLIINCRDSHIACCFKGMSDSWFYVWTQRPINSSIGNRKLKPVEPPIRPTAPVGSPQTSVQMPNVLGPISSIHHSQPPHHNPLLQAPAISTQPLKPQPQLANGAPLPTILLTPLRPNAIQNYF